MKFSIIASCCILLLLGKATAFSVYPTAVGRTSNADTTFKSMSCLTTTSSSSPTWSTSATYGSRTQLHLSSQPPSEAAEQAAAMGLTLEQYTAVMEAQESLNTILDNSIVSAGDASSSSNNGKGVRLERDSNSVPKQMSVQITEKGKQLGKEKLAQEIISVFQQANKQAQIKRTEAHKTVMEKMNKNFKK